MRLNVVYTDERHFKRLRKPLSRIDPYEKRRRKPGPVGDGNGIYLSAAESI